MYGREHGISWLLADLVASSSVEIHYDAKEDCEISSIEYDSRKVSKGSLFVAIEGFAADGHDYIEKAVGSGAVAIVVSRSRYNEYIKYKDSGVIVLYAENSRKALSALSAAFFDFPSDKMICIGITGTNGKTSFTYMMESVMAACGYSTGVIGTVNFRWSGEVLPAENTTPESRDIQELLYSMEKEDVSAVIMEVSSHALELNRVDDISFNSTVFTNLTRDHLDFHENFDNYFAAKKRLFALLETSTKKAKSAIINIDDAYGDKLYKELEEKSFDVISYGCENKADYMPYLESIKNEVTGLHYIMKHPDADKEVKLHLAGTFHVYNSLAALCCAHSLGCTFESINQGFDQLQSVPGRFDVLHAPGDFSIVVDYAHTVDALEKLLESVQELDHNRVITVFGCGGDRDRTKRPLMGDAAARLSDVAIVTSDNPRSEDPEDIVKDIVAGLDMSHVEVIVDREKAIAQAISMARQGDIVVIAGKGHEDYQIIGSEKIHFDDKEIARKYTESGSIA